MSSRSRYWAGARVLLSIAIAALAAKDALAQPPRDAPRLAAGTALIGGTVTTDDEAARPLRRVLVTLAGSGLPGGIQVVTDDAGRFAFADLAGGRYTLTAQKPAYVKTYYGSRRPGRGPGTALALAAGQRLTNVSIRLTRGAAIEGTVVDDNANPVSSAQVSAVQPVVVNGQRKLVSPPGGDPWATTDDRGVYRLYGLPPGEYTVRTVGGGAIRTDTRLTTTAAVDAALREARMTARADAIAPDAPPAVARSTAYFPGVADAALAEFFTLAAGEERTGTDIRSSLVRATRVEGTAVGPGGQPIRNVMMGLANVSSGSLWTSIGGIRPDAEGHFSVGSLTPGRYAFFGRGSEDAPPVSPATALPLWTWMEVTVNEQDVVDLVVQFLPGASVSGRIAAIGAPPPDFTKARITLAALPAIGGTMLTPPAVTPRPDGSFRIDGVPPGAYRLAVAGAAPWVVRSAMLDGRDTLDQPLEVAPGRDVTNLVVSLTDRPTEITGTLFDQLDRPAPEYAIVVFSTNRAYWTSAPRRMSGVIRLGTDGRFTVSGLPPGEYFLAALIDPDPAMLADQTFLERLAQGSIRISLAEGERKVQDLKLPPMSPSRIASPRQR